MAAQVGIVPEHGSHTQILIGGPGACAATGVANATPPNLRSTLVRLEMLPIRIVDTEFVVCNFEEDHWRGRDAYAFFRNLQKARRNRGKTECQACSRQRADQRKRGVSVARSAGTVISPVRSIDP